MTKQQRKKAQNRRAIAALKAKGWRPIFYRLPEPVRTQVIEFKNKKMAEWREAQSAPPIELVNEIVGRGEA